VSEYLPFILFFIFFILPLLERALKGGKQEEQPPPAPRRERRPELDRPADFEAGRGERDGRIEQTGARAQPPPSPEPAGGYGDDAAADMIPDDLWEILTGERRPRSDTQRRPEPAYDPLEWEEEAAAEEAHEDVSPHDSGRWDTGKHAESGRVEDVLAERERAVHSAERAPVHEAPLLQVFDAESVPTDAARHAAFHRRIDEMPVRPARLPPPALALGSIDELRRAFVLKEILGKPKALE